MSLMSFVAWSVGIYWILVSALSLKIALGAFKKYPHYKNIENVKDEWKANVRTDYRKWDKNKIIIGCLLFVPAKFFIIFVYQSVCVLTFHIFTKKNQVKMT